MSEPAPILRFPDSDPPPKRKRSRRLPQSLTEAEYLAVITRARFEVEEAHTAIKRAAAQRDEVMLHLGLRMGLRLSEIIGLDVDHLDLDGRRCRVMHGKGDKDRVVPIPSDIVQLLRTWIGDRRDGIMFPSKYGGRERLDDSTIEWRFQRLGELAAMTRRLKPHQLRHSAAQRLLQKCKNIRIVQEFLGHANIATTMIYTYITVDEVAEAMELP